MRAALVFVLALLALRGSAAAQAQPTTDYEALARWARREGARGNRIGAEQIDHDMQALLLDVLAKSVASCDCLPRRIRWVWPLANPQQPARPKLVVSFDDRPRDDKKLATFERYALLHAQGDVYQATSVLNLGRPNVASGGSLRVQLKPRRDLDGDGELDVWLSFAELWPDQRTCGYARFQSSLEAAQFEEIECAP